MMYIGSVITSDFSSNNYEPNSLYQLITLPFLQSLCEIGYFHPTHLIDVMEQQLHIFEEQLKNNNLNNTPTNDFKYSSTYKQILSKYQILKMLISGSNPIQIINQNNNNNNNNDDHHNHHHHHNKDNHNNIHDHNHNETLQNSSYLDFFLFIPVVVLRYHNYPQLYSTIQKMVNTLTGETCGTKRCHVTGSCLLLTRILEKCINKKCQPSEAMRFIFQSFSSSSSSLIPFERKLLGCIMSDELFHRLIQINNILSNHPSFLNNDNNDDNNNSNNNSENIQIEIDHMMDYIANEIIDSYQVNSPIISLELLINKFSGRQKEIWDESEKNYNQQTPIIQSNQKNDNLEDQVINFLSKLSNCLAESIGK